MIRQLSLSYLYYFYFISLLFWFLYKYLLFLCKLLLSHTLTIKLIVQITHHIGNITNSLNCYYVHRANSCNVLFTHKSLLCTLYSLITMTFYTNDSVVYTTEIQMEYLHILILYMYFLIS